MAPFRVSGPPFMSSGLGFSPLGNAMLVMNGASEGGPACKVSVFKVFTRTLMAPNPAQLSTEVGRKNKSHRAKYQA